MSSAVSRCSLPLPSHQEDCQSQVCVFVCLFVVVANVENAPTYSQILLELIIRIHSTMSTASGLLLNGVQCWDLWCDPHRGLLGHTNSERQEARGLSSCNQPGLHKETLTQKQNPVTLVHWRWRQIGRECKPASGTASSKPA